MRCHAKDGLAGVQLLPLMDDLLQQGFVTACMGLRHADNGTHYIEYILVWSNGAGTCKQRRRHVGTVCLVQDAAQLPAIG